MKATTPPSFYLHGKFFDSEEEFWQYARDWPELPVDLKEFQNQLDMRMREVAATYKSFGNEFTNRQAHELLRLSSEWVVASVWVTEEEQE